MNPTRRTMLAAGALAALGFHPAARAQAPAAGRDYSVLGSPLPVDNPAKVEVLEFFWYGCIHCYNLEPAVDAWLEKLPADVEFRRIPAVFNERWQHDASIFYTLESMGLTQKTHASLFDAIHNSRLNTINQPAFTEWMKKHGIDPKKFEDTFKSFGVQSKVRRATQLTAAYRIDGTPALAVHGTYTISADQARSPRGMFATTDYLVGIARKSLGVKR